MKTDRRYTKVTASKGDRLGWAHLSEVKPVALDSNMTQGRKLSPEDFAQVNMNNSSVNIVLVP